MTKRIRISLPETFPFETEIAIRVTDLNYGNHLANDAVLSLVHEARVQFLVHHGWSEFDVEGVGMILSDSAIIYKSRGEYGQVLKAQVAVDHLSKVGCDFFYLFTDRVTGKEVARAKTGAVFFDYTKERTVRIPEGFLKKFEK